MNFEAKTFDTPAAVELEGTLRSTNPPVLGDSLCCVSMTLSEIAANLGTSLEDVVLLEQRAMIKARVWAQENDYHLADLLDISKLGRISPG